MVSMSQRAKRKKKKLSIHFMMDESPSFSFHHYFLSNAPSEC